MSGGKPPFRPVVVSSTKGVAIPAPLAGIHILESHIDAITWYAGVLLDEIAKSFGHGKWFERSDGFDLHIGTRIALTCEGHRNTALKKGHHIGLGFARRLGQCCRQLLKQRIWIFQTGTIGSQVDERQGISATDSLLAHPRRHPAKRRGSRDW